MSQKNHLDDFQKVAIERSRAALLSAGRALLVAPTGAGKTVMMGELIRLHHSSGGRRTIVLQRRVLIGRQNHSKISGCVGHGVGLANGEQRWKNVGAPVVVATVGAVNSVVAFNVPKYGSFDLIVIDEAHNAASQDFLSAIAAIRSKDPTAAILGLTATPERADGVGICGIFGPEPAAVVTLRETIEAGRNVHPLAHAIVFADEAVSRELANEKWSDMDSARSSVDAIIKPSLGEVVKHWRDVAADRKTVCFCPSIAVAEALAVEYERAGVSAIAVSTRMTAGERRKILTKAETGQGPQVLTCATLLLEGFDSPSVSCVVLLRGFAHKSTFIQAVGRGLRAAENKTDCLVLDGLGVTLKHADVVAGLGLAGRNTGTSRKTLLYSSGSRAGREVIDATGGDLVQVPIGVTRENPQSRIAAMAAGETTYATNRPCANGHVAHRDIYGRCIQCKVDEEKDKTAERLVAAARQIEVATQHLDAVGVVAPEFKGTAARPLGKLSEHDTLNLPAGRYSDGGGLYLLVDKGGARRWLFIYRRKRDGKQSEIGLGGLQTVPPAMARRLAALARRQIIEGIDPLEAKRQKGDDAP